MSFSSKDPWRNDYDSLVELGARIGVKIRERDAQQNQISHSTKLNTSIDKMLQDYQRKLQNMRATLHRQSSAYSMTDSEYQRKQSIIDELSSKQQQLQRAHNKGWSTANRQYAGPREDLWGSEGVYGPGSAHRMNVDEIRTQQQKILEEQDLGLDALSKALRRQQEVGLAIQEEVTEHNVLIDDIHDATSRANQKIKRQTRRVDEVRRKESCKCTCLLWSIIILLAAVILILAFVKYDHNS